MVGMSAVVSGLGPFSGGETVAVVISAVSGLFPVAVVLVELVVLRCLAVGVDGVASAALRSCHAVFLIFGVFLVPGILYYYFTLACLHTSSVGLSTCYCARVNFLNKAQLL